MFTALPSKIISPSSNGWMPATHLINVLLPAPLSPTRAVTSPARTSRSTSRRTWTAPKLLLMPRRDSSGSRCCPSTDSLISADAVLFAGLLQFGARADLLGGREPVGDHVLDVLREDRLRLQQHGLDLLLGLGVLDLAGGLAFRSGGVALGQRDRQRGGRVGLLLDRLIDGHALRAQQDPLQALVGRVLA